MVWHRNYSEKVWIIQKLFVTFCKYYQFLFVTFLFATVLIPPYQNMDTLRSKYFGCSYKQYVKLEYCDIFPQKKYT